MTIDILPFTKILKVLLRRRRGPHTKNCAPNNETLTLTLVRAAEIG